MDDVFGSKDFIALITLKKTTGATARLIPVAKRAALHRWAHAVTEHGGFSRWTWGVSKSPSDLQDVVRAAASW